MMAQNVSTEEVTVPVLAPDGKVKFWTRVETIEANTGEERKLCTLSIETKTSGVRRDSCQAVTSVTTANGERVTRKIIESTKFYTVKKWFTMVSVEGEEESSSSSSDSSSPSPPGAVPPPPPPPTPKGSSERQDSDAENKSSSGYPDDSSTMTHASAHWELYPPYPVNLCWGRTMV